MADAIPLPWELLSPPAPAPRVAQGHVEIVLVDLTRPAGDRFSIRAYEEDFQPPPADVVGAWVLYGASLATVIERLHREWRKSGVVPVREISSRAYVAFEFDGPLGLAVHAIKALAESFPP